MTQEPLETPLEIAVSAEPKIVLPDSGADIGRPVVIYTASSPQDGEIVRGILESEGIPVVLTNAAGSAFGEVFSIGEGQAGEILVAPEDVERANSILEAANAANLPEM